MRMQILQDLVQIVYPQLIWAWVAAVCAIVTSLHHIQAHHVPHAITAYHHACLLFHMLARQECPAANG